jgi:formylglycine-generating enzyme required for sulfatase activity
MVTALSTACSNHSEPLICLSEAQGNQTQDIRGGAFKFGENRYYANERPVLTATVKDFNIDRTEVTNRQFKAFVDATGYVTAAERGLSEKEFPDIPAQFRVPGSMVFIPPTPNEDGSPAPWWQFVAGANWQQPMGPHSSIEGKESFPVVQLTHEDALAYATWLGRRLPTEEEWEYASRGGLQSASYSWGEEPPHRGKSKANTWHGFVGSSPVGCFAANGYGLYDMTGNVWEWTSTAYGPDHNRSYGDDGYDPQQPGVRVKTLKGGSFLCSDNYCQRFRPASRQAQDVTLGSSHIGFRTAK